MADNNAITPTPENPIPDVDDIKPGIPSPAWSDEGGGGTGGGVLVVNQTYDEALEANVLDKTWKEINESPFAVIVEFSPFGLVRSFVFVTSSTPTYGISSVTFVGNEPSYIVFTASTENDYPVAQMG